LPMEHLLLQLLSDIDYQYIVPLNSTTTTRVDVIRVGRNSWPGLLDNRAEPVA